MNLKKGDVTALKEIFKDVFSGFTLENKIVHVVYQQKN
tara:strand:+ start:641 stop:754 length:114 start_codon:yes stop_codon:yes gene_type:complete